MKTATLPKTIEFKTLPFQVKSVDEDQGIVIGMASRFGKIDLQKDTVPFGSYKKTLVEANARMSNGRRFMYPTLWMHDPNQPTGGVISGQEEEDGLLVTMKYDISVNAAGIPNNPIATMVFSGFKQGYIDELSIGYVCLQKDYENGIRVLKEIQLFEISAVTMLFAADPGALVSAEGVKNILGDNGVFEKSASGKTTWALADKDTKWDSGQASKDIQEYAADGDDLDWKKVAQCYFWVAENPPTKLGDCKLPFVAKVGDKMMAVPQGVISVAGAIQGARTPLDIPDGDVAGVKAKVATYYKKLDMTPPWEDTEKMNTNKPQKKDFNTLFQATQAQDCLEDWGDLINTLTQAMMELFCMGDQPQADMGAALQQFEEAVGPWTEKAMSCGLANYISDTYGYSSNCYVPYSLRVGGYDAMSRGDKPDIKSGARFSEDTKTALSEHVKSVMDVSKKMQNMSDELAQHAGSLQDKANDLTNLYQSEDQGPAFAEDNSDDTNGKSNSQDNQSEKRREPSQQTLTRKNQPPQSTEITIDDLEALLVN